MANGTEEVEFLQQMFTPFHPRPQDPVIEVGRLSDRYVLICSRKPEKLDLVHEQEGWARLKRSIKSGGFMVRVNRSECYAKFDIAPAPGFDPPDRLLFLAADGTTTILPISAERRYQFTAGDHFLFPVDREAAQSLQRLYEDLRYLSPDQERNVWHVIGRPGWELRMQAMETRLRRLEGRHPESKAVASATPARAATLTMPEEPPDWDQRQGRLGQWVRNRRVIVRAAAAGLFTLLIVWLAVAFFGKSFPFAHGTPQTAAGLQELLSAVSQSSSPTIREIAKKYDFPPSDETPLSGVLRANFVEGLIQLERIGKTREEEDSNIERGQKALIVWLSCQVSKPAVPETVSKATGIESCDAPEANETDAAAGTSLESLAERVKTFHEPAQPSGPYATLARKLVEAIKNSSDPAIKKLYKAHNLNELDGGLVANKTFAAAVLKLELLRWNLLRSDSKDLDRADTLTDTKAAIPKLNPAQAHISLLAYLFCQSAENGASSGLPAFPGSNGDCTSSPNERYILNGFAQLTTFAATGTF